MNAFTIRPPAPALFIGMQDGCGIIPPFGLYILEAPVGIHPAGSTVSKSTLEKHGYWVAEEPAPSPRRAPAEDNHGFPSGTPAFG